MFKFFVNLWFWVIVTSSANAEISTVVDFETIDKGYISNYRLDVPTRMIEINNHKDWSIFWGLHSSSGIEGFRERPVPSIDFEKHYILVAIESAVNNRAASLTINSIEVNHDGLPLSIALQSRVALSNALTLSIDSRPFHIVKVKK